jgi:hypothetical protein
MRNPIIFFKICAYYLILIIALPLTLIGCNGGGSQNNLRTDYVKPLVPTSESGALTISVSGNKSGVCSWYNMPCVSVTICNPADPSNPNKCTTINNILLDTGSYGLRVFSSVLPAGFQSNNLPQLLTTQSQNLAEKVEYGDGDCNWGPVVNAVVKLGSSGEQTSPIPIQIIDATYLNNRFSCSSDPNAFGSNGILGVGPYANDGNVSTYYAINGKGVPLPYSSVTNNQLVKNPVAYLTNSSENNGITITLPAIGPYGAYNPIGYATFGVNSALLNSNIYSIQPVSQIPISMTTTLLSVTPNIQYGFLDTGSNGLFFITPELSNYNCNGWYCPTNDITYTPNNTSGIVPISTTISVTNANTLFNTTNNNAANNLAGGLGGNFTQFIDYGLPFFFGKNVQICFSGKVCNGRNGPYWAF